VSERDRHLVLAVSEVTEGGVGRHLKDLLPNITNFDVVLAAPKPLNVPCEFAKIDLKRTPKLFVKGTLQLLRLIHKIKPDVVHLHSSIAGAAGRLCRALMHSRIPVVYTPNGLAFTYEENRFKRRIFKEAERYLSCLCDAIIAVSQAEQETMRQLGIPPHKVVLIHNAIPLPEEATGERRLNARRSLGLPEEATVVGAMGRLAHPKLPLDFVKAIAYLAPRFKHVSGVWIGDGELFGETVSYAERLGIDRHIHITGWRTDALDLLPAFDIFVFVSCAEGMPYSLLEAAGTGLPCVATDVAGVRDVIRDGVEGFVVPPRDPRALAEKILILIEDCDLRRRMGQAARQRVAKHFSLEQMVQKTQQLYLHLLRQRRAPSP